MDRYQQMAELQRNWTPPAELLGSSEREVRLSGRGMGIAVLAGLLFIGGAGAGIALVRAGSRESNEQGLLNEQGKDAEATVTRVWRTGGKDNRPMVAYQFEAEGRTYRRSVGAPLKIWKSLFPGSPLTVRFLPSDPARNHPRDWPDSQTPLWVAILVGAGLVGTGVILVIVLRRQLALLRDGRPAPAVVTRHSWAQHGQKNFHYEFPLLGGSVEKGKRGPTRRPPAIGATLCVLYDPDNPRRNAPYPLEMATLVNAGSWQKK